ncbi:LysR family transcriptional regulator [Ramlibacter sp. G-1-2-2]|uniref:LysR family transcriptional regulator n=1 Tax=Ramlibacter agri TaxID=2728837 RepID=A0A848GY94_9BURK|nr:LysR substrate-binding domain-containing protein [Ramlibacter agri]NML42252.1 LysR family transcriptional regulator [Ramlibacter agri]
MSQIDSYLQVTLKARQLRLLVALDDFGHLKEVAEITHVTVPAVSKALAELERGLGLELFVRTTQGLRPTPHGECLIRHARQMLVSLHQARAELKALSSPSEDKINVGVFPASVTALLPKALALLKQREPRVNVLVTEGMMATLMPELRQGKLDMIVGRLPARDGQDTIAEQELLEEPVSLLVRPAHPLAGRKKLKWADLKPYPWVLPPVGALLRDPLERILESHDIRPKDYIETSSTTLARAYLHASDGIGAMAGAVARDPAEPLARLPLALPQLIRGSGVFWDKRRALTPAARLMIACLEEAAAGLRPHYA